MNTILQWQVFSPIPFAEMNPSIVYNSELPRPSELDINKNYGHFDGFNSKHISFYVKDYWKGIEYCYLFNQLVLFLLKNLLLLYMALIIIKNVSNFY